MNDRPAVRAFTLIELLVVIAIIGVLSSVIVSALDSARAKGTDAAIKTTLTEGRTQASLFLTNNGGSYIANGQDVCAPGAVAYRDSWIPEAARTLMAFVGIGGSAPVTVSGIYPYVLAAAQQEHLATVTLDSAGGPGIAVCNSTATSWGAQVPLSTPGLGYFCVDSTATATITPVSLLTSGTDTSC